MATEKLLIDLWSVNMNEVDTSDCTDVEDILSAVVTYLSELPTVDAVEVVRCKDCIHWYEPEETCLKIYSDGAVSAYAWQFRGSDDFCSYGERKENG